MSTAIPRAPALGWARTGVPGSEWARCSYRNFSSTAGRSCQQRQTKYTLQSNRIERPRTEKKFRSKYMCFDHMRFFASLPDGDLAAFPQLSEEVDGTVIRWCRQFDNRDRSFDCICSFFRRDRHLLRCRTACESPAQYDSVPLSNLLSALDQFYELRPATTAQRIAKFEKASGIVLPKDDVRKHTVIPRNKKT